MVLMFKKPLSLSAVVKGRDEICSGSNLKKESYKSIMMLYKQSEYK